eukprot:5645799-Pleurochrysis_carterae.AAC.2
MECARRVGIPLQQRWPRQWVALPRQQRKSYHESHKEATEAALRASVRKTGSRRGTGRRAGRADEPEACLLLAPFRRRCRVCWSLAQESTR